MDYWVEMEAVEATDESGYVEYFFVCRTRPDVFPDGCSSGWQSEPTYTVLVGTANQALEFRVRTRDGYGNLTQWSEWAAGIQRSGPVPIER
jgi:hypothetical protein